MLETNKFVFISLELCNNFKYILVTSQIKKNTYTHTHTHIQLIELYVSPPSTSSHFSGFCFE